MSIFRRFTKPITHLILLGFLALTLHVPAVQAGLVGTDAIVNAHQAQQARDHVRAMLDRADVQQQLLSQGVNPGEVQARVNALTSEEAQQLATRLDQLPAGGVDALVIAAVVFFALLATDILGYTDIFPFVKKPAR
jgi:uncharacterized protein DUF6627